MSKTIIVEGPAQMAAYTAFPGASTYAQSRYQADGWSISSSGQLTIIHGGDEIAVHPAGKWNRVFVEQAKAVKAA